MKDDGTTVVLDQNEIWRIVSTMTLRLRQLPSTHSIGAQGKDLIQKMSKT